MESNSDLAQWQSDCERLSEPQQQWEFKTNRGKYLGKVSIVYFNTYKKVLIPFLRIESLALPFDYDDAVNGGKVEVRLTSASEFFTCIFESKSGINNLCNVRLPSGLVT